MDAVAEIKARLPIDELVRQYCQLHKKGRNFVALCPFHHDTHPSFLISPDKGICYCFPCQKGGDIFSFYQQIEGVDFRQALKDLAEKTGVSIAEADRDILHKDEKERLRECLEAASLFYKRQLKEHAPTQEYLQKRGVLPGEIELFGLGLAPDSFNATYDHLLKAGFSRKEIQICGIGIQKDLADERMYDRFRNRLMFPIQDVQGRIIGFGGRTLGADDAKYLNSQDSPLYHKSSVLFGIHHAREAIRETKRVLIVEGYFDVLACHRVGVHNVVAACGTALTEDHVRLLKRHAETIVLCLDQDKAGKAAAERAFMLCSREGLLVQGVLLPEKDPADMAVVSREELLQLLTTKTRPYLDIVYDEVRQSDLSSPDVRSHALQRILTLLSALSSATERSHAIRTAAVALGTTETSLIDDLRRAEQAGTPSKSAASAAPTTVSLFSSVELCLALLLMYPRNFALLQELIPPEEGWAMDLYHALKERGDFSAVPLVQMTLPEDLHKQASIVMLYCEQNGFADWGENVAVREIRRNCLHANREFLRRKQQELTKKLVEARKTGEVTEEALLQNQYQQLLKLAKMAS